MKTCQCRSNECNGNVERYSIHSPAEKTTYPNRFWGIVDYCDTHKQDDIKQGFVLTIANEQKETFVL
jgi:hypothetical protein